MNGKGTLFYCAEYPAYDGEWSNDQFHGFGILYNENPMQLNEAYDFRDFNEVDEFWIKYEGNYGIIKVTSCMTIKMARENSS